MYKLNENVKYISFDVFDTLIKRFLPVDKLYELIEKELIHNKAEYGKDFAKKRIRAELLARNNIKNYSLSDIYAMPVFDDISAENKKFLMELECNYELKNVVTAYYGEVLYKRYRDKYKIICISDMYLSSEVIRKMLTKCGYDDITDIIVSYEWGCSKREGSLYTKVVNNYNISPSELFHIGDAWRSDFFNPKKIGISSQHINIIQELKLTDNDYYNLGFNTLGPLIYEFCNWIHSYFDGYKKLFLAREGEVLKQYYDLLFPSDKSEILYVSREAVKKYTNNISEENIFVKYLELVLEKKNLFIDLGWQGSMQTMIDMYINPESNIIIEGAYLGVTENNKKFGFLFNSHNNLCKKILCFSGLLELLFMPSHGTVIDYSIGNDGEVTPEFQQSEFTPESIKNISDFQQGVKDLIRQCEGLGTVSFDIKTYLDKIIEFGCQPNRKSIERFGGLEFYDFGRVNRLVEKASLIRPKTLINNFILSKWKTAYLKNIMHLRLPYAYTIKLLRKFID